MNFPQSCGETAGYRAERLQLHYRWESALAKIARGVYTGIRIITVSYTHLDVYKRQDDTNDMNNFDTAMAALRAYRSERKAYRGSNGEIDRLAEELRALEDERFRAEGKRPELESVLREIDAQNAQQTEKTAELALVRADIQKAAGQRERQLKKERLYEPVSYTHLDVYKRQPPVLFFHFLNCIMLM